MSNVIKWVSLTEFARRTGVCLNTFKKYYLWQIPEPQMQNNHRRNWSEQVVIECIEKIQSGELIGREQTE